MGVLFLRAYVTAVRNGLPFWKKDIGAKDWPDLSRVIEAEIRTLSHENPDRIVITLERPQ
jgi:hypothetical protein